MKIIKKVIKWCFKYKTQIIITIFIIGICVFVSIAIKQVPTLFLPILAVFGFVVNEKLRNKENEKVNIDYDDVDTDSDPLVKRIKQRENTRKKNSKNKL